jgi:hypothetical protein
MRAVKSWENAKGRGKSMKEGEERKKGREGSSTL